MRRGRPLLVRLTGQSPRACHRPCISTPPAPARLTVTTKALCRSEEYSHTMEEREWMFCPNRQLIAAVCDSRLRVALWLLASIVLLGSCGFSSDAAQLFNQPPIAVSLVDGAPAAIVGSCGRFTDLRFEIVAYDESDSIPDAPATTIVHHATPINSAAALESQEHPQLAILPLDVTAEDLTTYAVSDGDLNFTLVVLRYRTDSGTSGSTTVSPGAWPTFPSVLVVSDETASRVSASDFAEQVDC